MSQICEIDLHRSFQTFYGLKNIFNRRFSSNCLLIVIDVFEHHRFCDEYSHLLNGCFPSSVMLYWCLKSFKLILINLFKLFMTSRTYSLIFFIKLPVDCNRCFWTSEILWWILKSYVWLFSVVRNSLLMSQICETDLHRQFQTFYDLQNLFNRRFSSNYLLIVIYVFKHHRFCDEFSHLLNGCFPSSVMLYWCLKSVKLIFIDSFKFFMTSRTYSIDVFHQITCSL